MSKSAPVFVAGHGGLVGNAVVRKLQSDGFVRIVTRSRSELDLRDQAAVAAFFAAERPEYVYLAAAKVGGITPTIRSLQISCATTWRSRPTSSMRPTVTVPASCWTPRNSPSMAGSHRSNCMRASP